MKKRITLISSMAAGALLLGGCQNNNLTALEQTFAAQQANRGVEGAEEVATGPRPFVCDEEGEPFFQIEAPEGFYINEHYYVSNERLEFEYSPEDMDYVYQPSMSDSREENISTFSVDGSQAVEDTQDGKETLERIKETRVSRSQEEGTPYSAYNEDDYDLGPFKFILQTTREGYEHYAFYGVQQGRLITAVLTVPEDTGEQDAIFERTLEALQSMTFEDAEEWEEPADQTQEAQTIRYTPYEKSSTDIPRAAYSFTVPALPEGFRLGSIDPLDGYTVSNDYPEIEKPGSFYGARTSFHLLPLAKERGYFREEELRNRPEEAFTNDLGEPAEAVEYLHDKDDSDLGDFTTGVRTSYKEYERYLFVTETENYVLIGRYFLPKQLENRQEIKELYDQAIASFDMQAETTK